MAAPAFTALRAQLEEALTDPEAKRAVGAFLDRTYRQEARAMARESADIRAELLRRGLAQPEALDAAGLLSHDALDEAAEQGRLDAVVEESILRFRKGTHEGGRFMPKRGAISHPLQGLKKSLKGRGKLSHPDAQPARTAGNQRIVHPNRLTPGPSPAPGVTRTLKGHSGAVKGKKFKVYETPPVEPKGTDVRATTKKVKTKSGDTKGVRTRDKTGDAPDNISAQQIRHDRSARGDTKDRLQAKGTKRAADLAKEARLRSRKARKAGDTETADKLERKAADLEKTRGVPAESERLGKKAAYDERTKKLEKNVSKEVTKGVKEHPHETDPTKSTVDQKVDIASEETPELSQAEAEFNDAGRLSSRTLLHYANQAATQPTTVERYRDTTTGAYDSSRKALHDRIIDGLLRERNDDGSISFTAPYLGAADGDPTVIFTGGGYAAGKGGVLKTLAARGELPDNAFVLDPDLIKAELPEFKDALESDPEANLLVYQEAWDIAQRSMVTAREKHLNVVIDGISNTSAEEMAARVQSFTDAGYTEPRAYYVSAPTDSAIERAHSRAEEAKSPSDRRMIPEVIMRAVHRDVSATIPPLMERAGDLGLHVEVFDTNRGKDKTTNQWKVARKVATAHPNGAIEHHDRGAFQAILDKAHEGIQGVDQPKDKHATLPASASAPPEAESRVAETVTNALPPEQQALPEDAPPQPFSDFDSLYGAASKDFDGFKTILDGVVGDMGGDTHPLYENGKPDVLVKPKIGEARQEVKGSLDKVHGIMGALKGRERAEQKAKTNGIENMDDMVRGTVLMPGISDFPKVMEAVTRHAQENGWEVSSVKNRMIQKPQGNTDYGYRDFKITLHSPEGLETELQINTTHNYLAKEGMGHTLFERARPVLEAVKTGQKLTPEQKAEIDKIKRMSRTVYGTAWRESLATLGAAKAATQEVPA